ncbi:hypothetical protein BC830DRAFT_1149426 [Chytriomyces sp. MP71]|nr:hypothetical protein BC830DRAFT_1149426 [Chytriomyces sp. MP71]
MKFRIPPSSPVPTRPSAGIRRSPTWILLALALASWILSSFRDIAWTHSKPIELRCKQLPWLRTTHSANNQLQANITDAVEHLSEAIQVRTESFDVESQLNGTAFIQFHNLVARLYPKTHLLLERKVVANYSLLYTWKGSDEFAPPLMLMAHIDVVPVLPETAGSWKYDPFSGFVDEENGYLWGRGSADTKATLIGILEAVEGLIESGFTTPKRTLYLGFGHDEESFGHGAMAIADYMENDLGLAGKIGMIVDEGSGISEFEGLSMALVAVSEKGYVDVDIIVETSGGHSSVPPLHTGIGFSALLINALESASFPILLSNENAFLGTLACYTEHHPLPDPFLKWAIENLPGSRKALRKYLSKRADTRNLLSTSQAVTVIRGGLKVNALPEKVVATVNHRISVDSALKDVETHYIDVLGKVVEKYRLDLTVQEFGGSGQVAWKKSWGAKATGNVTIVPKMSLEPSPISPFNDADDLAWAVLEGTIHGVFDDGSKDGQVIVSSFLMDGNTDTKSMWALSKKIYRFSPCHGEKIHTVDEHVLISSFLDGIAFYRELIHNWNK